MISVWALFDRGTDNRQEMLNKGFILDPVHGGGWEDQFNPPPGSKDWYDPWNPSARATYWRQIRDGLYNPEGVKADAFWMDTTEGPGALWHVNEYPLLTSRAIFEGWQASDPNRRATILGRSLFPGIQRYAVALWSGDIGTDMWSLSHQIPNGLGVSMTGLPYWTTDVGGFGGGFFASPEWSYRHDPRDTRYNETYVRWFQFGTFCPLFRVHTAGATSAPWEFGSKSEAICTKFLHLRYRLMPYIYSLAWRVTKTHYTMMRALPMDFMEDAAVRRITDQFMFGPALLVSPVSELGAVKRDVYLPAGLWYDFWTGVSITGGRSIQADAPLDRCVIHVRAGSIIPMGPRMQYTSEKPSSPIELRVYSGANASFILYDDDHETNDYKCGRYCETTLTWDDKTRVLSIGRRSGEFTPIDGHALTFRIVCVRKEIGIGVKETEKPDRIVEYNGRALQVQG